MELLCCGWCSENEPNVNNNSNDFIPSEKFLYEWKPSSAYSDVPPNAVRGGVDIDGSTIYVGRAFHEGDWIAAKVIPSKHVAYIPYGGGEVVTQHFDVLCGTGFEWVVSASGHVPENAVSSGNSSSGERLYVGRTHINGSLTPGKIHPSHHCIYVPFDGQEHSQREYEVLVHSPPKCEWIPTTGHSLPSGAIQGGHDKDGSPIYVARAYHESDLIPGKYVISHGVCYVAYGGSEHAKHQFDVLCHGNVSWVPTTNGHLPPGALRAGHTGSGDALYVGRSCYEGSITVGKVQPSHGTLYIPFGGLEIPIKEHEILVEH